MRNKLIAATVAAMTAGIFATAAMAAGPRPSSENYVPNEPAGVAVNSYDAVMMGPKTSSENHIPAQPRDAAGPTVTAAAPHYVYEQGYDPHGKWHGHWILVR